MKATAVATMLAAMPQTVDTSSRRRPTRSTNIMLTQVITRLVPDTTRPTATGSEKPTRAKRVPE